MPPRLAAVVGPVAERASGWPTSAWFGLPRGLHYGSTSPSLSAAFESCGRACILGPFESVFALGFGRSLGRTDNALVRRFGGLRVVVVKQYGRQRPPHVPLHIIRQHAQEYVRPYAILQVMMDRTDFQIHALQSPILCNCFSVAASSSFLLRLRSSASNGLRQAINRSPG